MKIDILKNNVRGSAFLTTLVLMLLMVSTGGYMYKASAQSSHFTGELRQATQAQAIAEAGLAQALGRLRGNWSLISSSFPSGSLGGGSYSTTLVTSGGRYLVRTTGTYRGHSRIASAEVAGPTVSALDYVIAGGATSTHTIDVGTGQSSGTIVGDIYMAGPVTIDGPSGGGGGTLAVTGDVLSQSTITSGSNVSVSGSQSQNWTTTVSFPTVDFSYYQAIAAANGRYYSSNQTFASGALPANPAGGVIFVNGDITIRGTQSTTACIIATGNITIQKSGSTYPRVTVNQFSNYPSLMTQTGNITFTSTGNGGAYLTVTGLIYSGNNFSVSTGNHDTLTVTGSILAKGTYSTSGMTAWNVTGVSYAEQTPPGFSSSNASMSVVSYNS
jgi:hypothetical protein